MDTFHERRTVDIIIDNFSQRQTVFADIFWNYQTLEEIQQFIKLLPTSQLQAEAISTYHMILAETFDQDESDLTVTQTLLENISRNTKS